MVKKLFVIAALLVLSFTEADAQLRKSYFYIKGREYIIDGRYREAIEALNILLRVETKDYEGYFLRGVAKYNLDDLSGANYDFTRAIDENPAYTLALQYRAITRSRMGQYAESLDDFRTAIELRPNQAAVYYSRGVTYFLNQQFEQAISDFDRFIKIEPREASGYINRGTSYLYLKDTTSAINNYNRAIEVNPYYSDGYLRRGLIQLMRQNYSAARSDLDRTIELDSTFAVAYFYRAMTNSYEDKLVDALKDFDRSIQYDSTNSVTIFNRAILRSQIGDYNRAIEDYCRVAESNPGNVLVFYNRAAVYAQIGDYGSAIADYSRAIELYPDFANAYLYRSQLKAVMRDEQGSKRDRRIAEAKISEYRSKLNDSTFSIYADTSKRFNQIMAFDADFGNKDFSRMQDNAQQSIKMLPMFRFTITENEKSIGYSPQEYRNERLDRFYAKCQIDGLTLSNRATALAEDSILTRDIRNAAPQMWNTVFEKAITQSLLKQYTAAMNFYNFAVDDQPQEPFALINRSATQTEMIDFIASLDGDYQNITINSDPATRLKRAARRTYDYTAAVADLRKAMELMPELPHVYYNLGVLMFQSGDMPVAIECFTRAIELFPYFAEAYYNRGLVQIYLKDSATGCLDLSKAGELGVTQAYEQLQKFCVK